MTDSVVNFTDDIRVPRIDPTSNGYPIDAVDIIIGGTTYKRQRVEVADPALPAGAAKEDTSQDMMWVLGKILDELKVMNIHLAAVSGEKINHSDIEG